MDPLQIPDQKTPDLDSRNEIEKFDSSNLAPSTLQCHDVNAALISKEALIRQNSMTGRATCVIRAKSDMGAPEAYCVESLVFNISCKPWGRIAEGKRDRGSVERSPHHKDTLKQLPEGRHSERLPGDTIPTQAWLAHFMQLNSISYGPRNIDHLVRLMPKLWPVKSIKQGDKLLTTLVGVVTAYRWLYEEMKLLHRDVSVENMMYRLDLGGNVVGVLSDYDLSIMLSEQENGPVSKLRIGTRPYMAIELLQSVDGNPPLHLCRYDLESMLYAILDLACFRHIPAEERKRSPIAEWFSEEYTAKLLARAKLGFLMENEVPNTSKGMEDLSRLVRQLYKMFRQGYIAGGDAKDSESSDTVDRFDRDTLGGHVTLEKFAKLFGI